MAKEITRTYSVITSTVVNLCFTEGQEPVDLYEVLTELVSERLYYESKHGDGDSIICKELLSETQEEMGDG